MRNTIITGTGTGTKTSSFGTNGRINHDSSKFYDSKLYKEFNNNKKNPDAR